MPVIDPQTAAMAATLAEELGLDPKDLLEGALDWVAYNWLGIGRCSSENRRKKRDHVKTLDDRTLADLVNGRIPWSQFSSGDCGKWFQAYAIQELLRRYEVQAEVEARYGNAVLAPVDPNDYAASQATGLRVGSPEWKAWFAQQFAASPQQQLLAQAAARANAGYEDFYAETFGIDPYELQAITQASLDRRAPVSLDRSSARLEVSPGKAAAGGMIGLGLLGLAMGARAARKKKRAR